MHTHLLRLRHRILTAIDYGKSPPGAFAIAIVGVILAVYATWFNDKKPGMGYAVALESTVLSDHAFGEGLTLFVNGQAIDVEQTPLVVLFVRLWNTGDTTFRPPDFDPKSPLGIKVSGGIVLKAKVNSASNEYLQRALTATLASDGSVTVPAAILEPKDAFVIKTLVKKPGQSVRLDVKAIGKLAGVSSFEEFYPHTAGRPELIIEYRSKSNSRLLLVGAAVLALLNLAHSLYRWMQRRRGSTKTVDGQQPK